MRIVIFEEFSLKQIKTTILEGENLTRSRKLSQMET